MKDTTFVTVFFVVFTVFWFVAFFYFLKLHLNHIKASNGVVNYDPLMRKFVYKVFLTSEEKILAKLLEQTSDDSLLCVLDPDELYILKLSDSSSSRKYRFQIEKHDDHAILRLQQTALFGERSYLPYKLNPFFFAKLGAEPIPFSQYGK